MELHLGGSFLGQTAITNTLLTSAIVATLIIFMAWLSTRRMQLVPSTLQNIAELIIEYLYDIIASIETSPRKARIFVQIVATFFIYILFSNYFGLLPGVGTIGFEDHGHFTALLRAGTSDLNTTLALALVSVGLAHYYSIKELGFKGYIAHWFSFNIILLFVGLLEIISEITKVVSLSFRLFGNIFAGETVLHVISSTVSPFATLPFLALELIVGFAQALVFAMLTLASLVILTMHHGSADEAH